MAKVRKKSKKTRLWCKNASKGIQYKLRATNGDCGEIKFGKRKAEDDEVISLYFEVSLQLTRKELKRVRRELEEKKVLIEVTGRWQGEKKLRRWTREGVEVVTKRQRYKVCVQDCFQGFSRVMFDRLSQYAKLQISEL